MIFQLLRCLPAWLALIVVTALAAGCQSAPPERTEAAPPPVLLISIDGFRHDYFERFDSPTMDRMIREGLKADSLYHAFPTKTFPTHYTLVTGRYPGTHGVVANTMWDPKRDAWFSLGMRDAVSDGYWYEGGEPIWVTAEKQGRKSATYFWPGSEARIHRHRPTHWKPYAGDVPHLERIGQVLEWAATDPEERPAIMTLYFSSVDSLGHDIGPAEPEVMAAAAQIDAEFKVLLDGLEDLGLLDEMHIIVVSDHGMTEIDIERYIMLDDYLDLQRVQVSDWGPAAQIWAGEMTVDEIIEALTDAHPRMRVWTREDIPARYRFGSHYRVPDVLAEADPGWMISTNDHVARRPPPNGMHGWDPAWGEMHGIFVARGPAFVPGSVSPAMRGVDVYALLTELLDLEPAWHEGSMAPFRPYMDATSPPEYKRLVFDCDIAGIVEARVGPAHMSLHANGYIHVLDQVDATGGMMRFEEVDLAFETDGHTARGLIDGANLGHCTSTSRP